MSLNTNILFASLGSVVAVSAFGAAAQWDNAQLHVLADLELIYEDNIFQLADNELSDMYVVFSPGVELRIAEEGAASAILRYQHSFTEFEDYSALEGDYANLSFRGRYNSGVVMASGYLTYEELYSSIQDIAVLTGGPVERTETALGANMRYEISELTAVRAGMDFNDVDYDLDAYTDYDSLSVPVTFFYKVRPRIDLTAGLRYRTTSTDAGIDYDDMFYFVGAVGELFSPVIFADVSIGFQDRDFKGVDDDASSASYDITFIYTGDVKTTVYAGFARDYRTSAIGGTAYAFTNLSLGARYDLSNQVGLNAGLVYGESEYERSPRAEDIMILNLGATYQPNDYLTLNAGYSYTDVDGANEFSATYSNSEIRVSASLRY